MGFIADDQIPLRHFQLFLQLLIPRQFVQAANTEIHFIENISSDSRLHAVIGQNLKSKMKLTKQFILPLFNKTSRRYDQASFQIPTGNQLFYEQSSHDCFAGTRVIRKHITKRQFREHLLINSRNLMRQWFDGRCMYCQIRVK